MISFYRNQKKKEKVEFILTCLVELSLGDLSIACTSTRYICPSLYCLTAVLTTPVAESTVNIPDAKFKEIMVLDRFNERNFDGPPFIKGFTQGKMTNA